MFVTEKCSYKWTTHVAQYDVLGLCVTMQNNTYNAHACKTNSYTHSTIPEKETEQTLEKS